MRRAIIGFIITCALGCLCVAPLAAHAQPPTHVHRIGYLLGTTREQEPYVEGFLEGMRTLGYVEGQHLVMEYRYAEGQYERFPALAAELVRQREVGSAVADPRRPRRVIDRRLVSDDAPKTFQQLGRHLLGKRGVDRIPLVCVRLRCRHLSPFAMDGTVCARHRNSHVTGRE